MKRIFSSIREKLGNNKMLIGCEAAAAEPFLSQLPFNDSRFTFAFTFGKPVPAYSYLFHEYINNFMGNQNWFQNFMDMQENPDNMLFRIGYAFTAGDMLTISLASEGKIPWCWDGPWDTDMPEQEPICTLIANLNPWRVGLGKKYLHHGKVLKTTPLQGIGEYVMTMHSGKKITYPDVMHRTYQAPDGSVAMILTNYLREEKVVHLCKKSKIFTDPQNAQAFLLDDAVTIPPLSAVLVEC